MSVPLHVGVSRGNTLGAKQTTVDGDGASWTAWVTDNSWAPPMFTDRALMVLSDALPGLRIEGKPQCHIVAAAKEQGEVVASVGCMLSRLPWCADQRP